MRLTKKQRLIKATFYRKAKDNPLVADISAPTNDEIALLTGCDDVHNWMKDIEFSNWFLEQDSNKSLIASGCQLAIEKLIYILGLEGEDSVGPKCETTSAAQVKAAETILRLGGFEPPKMPVKITSGDKELDDMDEKEMKKFIADNMPKVVKIKQGK